MKAVGIVGQGGHLVKLVWVGGGKVLHAKHAVVFFPLALGITLQMYDLFFKLNYCQVNDNIFNNSRHY